MEKLKFGNVNFERPIRHPSEDDKKVVGHSSLQFNREVQATDIHLRVKSKYMRVNEIT